MSTKVMTVSPQVSTILQENKLIPKLLMRLSCIMIVDICHLARHRRDFLPLILTTESAVERLSFHLRDEQIVIFEDNETIEEIFNRPSIYQSKFLAWTNTNKKYPEAKNLTYAQFPSKFVWKNKQRVWNLRKQGFTIGRLHFVPPRSGELYYLRNLLNYVKGPRTFAELRTVNNVIYPTFKDACYAKGLLDDDKKYVDVITKASHWSSAHFLRKLFATLLLSNQISRPEFVWERTWQYLSDNIQHRQRVTLQFQGDSQFSSSNNNTF